jgi:hypothetical protein
MKIMKYLQLYLAGVFVLCAGYFSCTGNHSAAYWNLFWALLNVVLWFYISLKVTMIHDVGELKIRVINLEAEIDNLTKLMER